MILGAVLGVLVGCGASSSETEAPTGPSPTRQSIPAAASPDAEGTAVQADAASAHEAVASDPVVAQAAPPEMAAPLEHTHADFDPDNDDVVGPPTPLEGCHEDLAEAGVTFKKARIGLGREQDGVYTCGAEQVVRYRGGPESIEYSRAPLLTCRMALALADFEAIAQEEAERELGTRIEKIDHLGTYNCRKMVAYDLISEHSFANGIDLRRFHLEDGRSVTVLEHFQPGVDDDGADAEARFLRGLSRRLYDEGVFSVVVTPYFDSLHRNHIHVDLARYRVDGSRP